MSHYSEQREADEIWKNADAVWSDAPSGTDFVVCNDSLASTYYATDFAGTLLVYSGSWWRKSDYKSMQEMIDKGFRVQSRPQTNTETHQNAQEPINKYSRNIIGLDGKTCQVDVYRVLEAFEVDSHAIAHSIKKLLAPGKRHAKSREQDLKEAIKSIEAELLLMEQRND